MNKEEARLSVIGAISMALKDPVLQHEFEIICKDLETEKQLNAEIKARFVKCNTCTDEMKSKCLMFSENLCQGERCEELVDLMGLISKSELEKENAELKAQIEKIKCVLNKIIRTVKNDMFAYGERLVKIYDISCEVLQELEK